MDYRIICPPRHAGGVIVIPSAYIVIETQNSTVGIE